MNPHNVTVKPIEKEPERKQSLLERLIRRLFPKPGPASEDNLFSLLIGWVLIFFTGPAILYHFGELSREVIFGTAFQAVAMVALALIVAYMLGSILGEYYRSRK